MEKSIQAAVDKIKKEMFSFVDLHRFVSASAYDTAWLAMIPNMEDPSRPMFPQCLEWTLHNQKELGFWGEPNHSNLPTIECILATVICMVALTTWDVGHDNIEKGLSFIHAYTEKLLLEKNGGNSQWLAIIFPGVLELGWSKGLRLFPDGSPEIVKSIFARRQTIMDMEKSSDQVHHHPPLIYYLEALPSTYGVDCDKVIHEHLGGDGSLFQSPSATAGAFMVTKNKECQHYLESMVQRCGSGACRYGVTPYTPLKGLFIQGPVFIIFYLAITNMVEKVPSFKGGGAFWFIDLTTPDSLYIFPVLTSLSFLLTVELNVQEGMEGNPVAGSRKKFSRILAVLIIPFTMNFPKAIFCYWVTSILFTLGIVINRSPVKKFLGLPDPVPPPTTAPQPGSSIFGASNLLLGRLKSLLGEYKSAALVSSASPVKQPKLPDTTISSSSVISRRVANLEKAVKRRKETKKR